MLSNGPVCLCLFSNMVSGSEKHWGAKLKSLGPNTGNDHLVHFQYVDFKLVAEGWAVNSLPWRTPFVEVSSKGTCKWPFWGPLTPSQTGPIAQFNTKAINRLNGAPSGCADIWFNSSTFRYPNKLSSTPSDFRRVSATPPPQIYHTFHSLSDAIPRLLGI